MTEDAIVATSWWMILPLGILGSLLHFLFDWTHHNRIAAVFGAVNESYWEHIKIAVWPVALLQLVLFAAGGWRQPSFVPAATIALYAVPVSMIGLVFLYKRLTRRNVLGLDIAVFLLVIGIAQTVFVLVLTELAAGWATIVVAAAFLVALVASFLWFTLHPPEEPDVFIDPIARTYGLDAHPDLHTRRAPDSRSEDGAR